MQIETTVAVIGGGATGVGVLRDLCMRGVKAVLLEQGNLANGTSSRFHGLLHSGARYAVSDPESALECRIENALQQKLARHSVEPGEGYFTLTPEDDEDYVRAWLEGCAAAGINAEEIDVDMARRLEPNLSPDIRAVYRVPDAGVDGFRLVWHNALSARKYGGQVLTYHKVESIQQKGGRITGLTARNQKTGEEVRVACDFVVNAAGSWCGELAHLAGLDVRISPDRGTLIVFNHRFTSRIINRLRKSSDGDIFVPHGSVTILGTTSMPTDRPDNNRPTTEEILRLLDIGKRTFPNLESYRILRAFAGTRPLYAAKGGKGGRGASRNFVIVDHEDDGLVGMASIFGGKLTTYRLMAEKISDLVSAKLGVTSPCLTTTVPLVEEIPAEYKKRAETVLPGNAAELAAERLGGDLPKMIELAEHKGKNQLLCECEMVSMAEIELVARDPATYTLGDIRLRTRLGMGTCQGTFCAIRTVGVLSNMGLQATSPQRNIQSFLGERWGGVRAALWGDQLREIDLGRAIYSTTLNLDGYADGQDL